MQTHTRARTHTHRYIQCEMLNVKNDVLPVSFLAEALKGREDSDRE